MYLVKQNITILGSKEHSYNCRELFELSLPKCQMKYPS